MRTPVLGLAFLLVGCGTPKEDSYREQLECYAVEEMMTSPLEPDGQVSELRRRQAADQLETDHKRLFDSARELGKSPADVVADARSLMNKIDWSNSHGTEEYLEQLMKSCPRTLGN